MEKWSLEIRATDINEFKEYLKKDRLCTTLLIREEEFNALSEEEQLLIEQHYVKTIDEKTINGSKIFDFGHKCFSKKGDYEADDYSIRAFYWEDVKYHIEKFDQGNCNFIYESIKENRSKKMDLDRLLELTRDDFIIVLDKIEKRIQQEKENDKVRSK